MSIISSFSFVTEQSINCATYAILILQIHKYSLYYMDLKCLAIFFKDFVIFSIPNFMQINVYIIRWPYKWPLVLCQRLYVLPFGSLYSILFPFSIIHSNIMWHDMHCIVYFYESEGGSFKYFTFGKIPITYI